MQHRILGRTGFSVSEIGLGCEHLQGMDYPQVKAVVDEALACGINLLDVFMSEPQVRTNLGRALRGQRDRVLLQGHLGAAWLDGQYTRTRDPAHYRAFFADFMERLETDYVDIGMIHFVDTDADYERLASSGLLDYARELRDKGVIRAIGMSSHEPSVARRAVEAGWCEVLMFSVNPAYDLLPDNLEIDALFDAKTYTREGLGARDPVRTALYEACEARGTAITVMKSLAAGTLLSAQSSPFGVALTVPQCAHYALTRPAVASVLIGCRTPEEVRAAVAYEEAGEQERDFSPALSGAPAFSLTGKCMYCNHCLPCQSHIDIAAVNRCLDLAEATDTVPATVAAHYQALLAKGGDCVACGACESRCPFGVPVIERMTRAWEIFES